MHGASCVERERTVGPEGSAGGGEKKSVHIPILQRGARPRQQEEMEGKRLVCPCPHVSAAAFVLKISMNPAFLLHLSHACNDSTFPSFQCVFIETRQQHMA